MAEAAPSTEDTIAGQIEPNPGEKVLIGEDGKEEVKMSKSCRRPEVLKMSSILPLKVSTPEKLEEIPIFR